MFTILLALMDVECQLLIIILPNTDEKSRFYDIFLDRKRKLVYGFSEAVHLAFKSHQHIHAYGYRKSEIAHLKYKVFHLFLLSGAIDMQPSSGIIFKYGQTCWKRELKEKRRLFWVEKKTGLMAPVFFKAPCGAIIPGRGKYSQAG